MRFNTQLLHGVAGHDERTGATNTPIFQSSAFKYTTAEELEETFKGNKFGFLYSRINNPTADAFERKISDLEKGVGSIACASGMAAITLAILNLVKAGEEIVTGGGLFGGTYSLFKDLEDYDIKAKHAKDNNIESYEALINERTRAIFIETIGNPKLDVPDIEKLSKLAHKNEIPLIVDNTITTPYLVKPFELGADIVIHSSSKYINGSGNSISGIIVDSGKMKWNYEKFSTLKNFKKYGKFVYLAKLRKGIFRDFGACLSPFNAYLNILGLETLGLRMERICDNTLKLVRFLKKNEKVTALNYTGLEDNPYHEISKNQFSNKYGGVFTLRLGTKEKAFKLINSLKYATNLANIGDTRTLVIHPKSTIYAFNDEKEIDSAGVFDDLVRVSVGIEDIEDLIEDFKQALEKIS
ncbi:MAG TPA: aminotransferase class I/II-fold pyridoxal phosphate-dependent enzyme [Clostridiaceae bacterium]